MRVEKRTIEVYVADDGEEFDTKRRCQLHDMLIKEQPTVLKRGIHNATDANDEFIELYPIASQDEYDLVCLVAGGTYPMPLNDTFAQYGRGWYMIYNYHDGYYAVKNLNKYIIDRKTELDEWVSKIIMKTSDLSAFKRDGDT